MALLGLAATAAPALAEPTADPLQKAYPLEQRPATVADAPAPSPASNRPREDGSDGPRLTQGAAIAIACAAMLLAGLVVTRRRRGAHVDVASSNAAAVASPAAEEKPVPAAGNKPAPVPKPAPAPPAEKKPAPVPKPAPAAAADKKHAPASKPTPAPTAKEKPAPARKPTAAPTAKEKPGPASKPTPAAAADKKPAPASKPIPASAAPPGRVVPHGVHCQIQWECDGTASWFTAVPMKFREREPVADSADFDWVGDEPPPRTPDAQAALHDLIEELQLDGWQPVRGRGRQHGAPRWYARRFVLPTLGPEPRIANEPMDSAEADIG